MMSPFELPSGPIVNPGETIGDYDLELFTNEAFLKTLIESKDLVIGGPDVEPLDIDDLPDDWAKKPAAELKALAKALDEDFKGTKDEAIFTIEMAIEDKADQ